MKKWIGIGLLSSVGAIGLGAFLFGAGPTLAAYVPTSLGQYLVTPPTLTNGQAFPLQLDVNGNLKTAITGSVTITGGGTSAADEAAFTAGTTPFTPVGGLYQTTSTSNPLTTGQAGVAQLTINRALHVNLRDATGSEVTAFTANAGTNLNTSALALDTSVAGLSLAQASTTSGQKGILAQGAVTTSAPSYTTAQTAPLSLDTAGNLRTTGSVTIGANSSVNLAQVNGHTTVEAGANGVLAVGGQTATNVAITEDPLNLGAQAVSSENSAATTARKVQLVATLTGKQITQPYANPENFENGTTAAITDTTSTAVIASAGGALRHYVTQCTATNSHATVGTFVKILDGSTVIYEGYAAAVGGGFATSFPTPLRGTAATALNCQPVTTGANVICSCSGYTGT